MERISKEQILKMGKKHKKWNEDVIVEIFPYLVKNNRYYLAYYMKKFTMDVKKIALVSPDSPSKDEALTALKPLINFTVVFGNIENFSKTRAELKFDVINEIRDYLEVILSSGLLSGNLMIYYERSFQIITEIIKLQDEMIKIRKKVNSMAQRILDRGYFMDEEIDESLELFSEIGWIQYKQFKDNYEFRHDFDIIYQNSNNPELRAFNRFKDDKTLFNMTSKIAEGRLKESLDIVTDKMDMSNFSKEDYVDHWTIKYQNILSERYDELRTKIRYP